MKMPGRSKTPGTASSGNAFMKVAGAALSYTGKKEQGKDALTPEMYETLREGGCDLCPLRKTWPKLHTPKIPLVHGTPPNGILCIGERPSVRVDATGSWKADKSGSMLYDTLAVHSVGQGMPIEFYNSGIGYTHAVRCHTTNVTAAMVACCSKLLEADIDLYKPAVIISLGDIPINALLPLRPDDVYRATTRRGNVYPVRVKDSYYPAMLTLSPRQAFQDEDSAFFFGDDIRAALVMVKDNVRIPAIDWRSVLFPYTGKAGIAYPGYAVRPGLVSVTGMGGISVCENILNDFSESGEPIGFDIETDDLRPYTGDIISYSFSDGMSTVSVLLDHPGVDDLEFKKESRRLLYSFLLRKTNLVIAHNLSFELEWDGYKLGLDIIDKIGGDVTTAHFADTLGMRAILPAHPDSKHLSLEDLCLQVFGFDLKGMLDLDRANLVSYPVEQLLEYNAGDAVVLPHLYKVLLRYVQNYKLEDTYRMIMDASVTAARMQVLGIPVNKEAALAMKAPLLEELAAFKDKIDTSDLCKEFVKNKGRLPNFSSSPDMLYILYDMYGLDVILNKKTNNPSSDKAVMALYSGLIPDLADIVAYKEMEKFMGTVLDSIITGRSKDGSVIVYGDGRIHTQFNLYRTKTYRSSTKPNTQQFPKRNPKFKLARNVVGTTDTTKRLIVVDSGQIDFRLAGISCLDENFVRATREGMDIHDLFAHHTARLCPARYEMEAVLAGTQGIPYSPDNEKDPARKRLRQEIKSGLVFARIYKAGVRTIARTLKVPLDVAEELMRIMDTMFPGIPAWHDDLYKFYSSNRAIRSITGTLLYGPMGFSDIPNYGIQHATRFVVASISKRLAIEHQLRVVNEIHDENTIELGVEEVDEAVPIIGKAFCDVPFDWIKLVPLTCEIAVSDVTSTGIGWGTKTKVAAYSSEDFGWTAPPLEDFRRFYEAQFQKIVRKPIYFM